MDLKSLLFAFDGRINRARYWFSLLLCSGVLATFLAILLIAFNCLDPSDRRSLLGMLPVLLLAAPMVVVMIWVTAATMIKRLHDRNKSGWWIVPFLVLPGIVDRIDGRLAGPSLAYAISAIVAGVGVWCFVETLCLKGTDGSNRFGPDPLVRTRLRRVMA
jgi:uncharacterized membrane protein YhaH (DUF805 family)